MTNITLSIPKELKVEMDMFPEINWSEVARTAIRQKIADLKFLQEFKAHSEITPDDAIHLGREVSKAMAKHY
ncbi:MAG: hypothetical protein ACE5J5_08880 [Candidatus Hydrothermarchaeales archaeon]